MTEQPTVFTTGPTDAWLARRVFLPPLLWLCRVSGWSSLRCARLVLIAGPVVLLVGSVAGALVSPGSTRGSAVALAALMGPAYMRMGVVRCRLTLRLERYLGELATGAIPPAVVRDLWSIALLRGGCLCVAALVNLGVFEGLLLEPSLIGMDLPGLACGVGVLGFTVGCYWGTVFTPPGMGAVARLRAWARGLGRSVAAPAGAGA